ncbi:MAG: hypothetical protein ACI4HK_03105, partial [Ruminococcus sp.]
PERPKGADCKSVVTDFGGSNPPSPTKKKTVVYAIVFFSYIRLLRGILLCSDIRLCQIKLPFVSFGNSPTENQF